MKLNELKIGENGIIKNFEADEGIYKRLKELGFVIGEKIKCLAKAPLEGPMLYSIMNYEISLNREEAEKIDVELVEKNESMYCRCERCDRKCFNKINRIHKNINIALVGNPNCGKTSLFNFLTGGDEKVGNYSGVTVKEKSRKSYYNEYEMNIFDLPGTYSLEVFSNEEKVTVDFLKNNSFDIIINVLDSTKLKRSLFLTMQLKEKYKNLICAFNFYDKFKDRGYCLDFDKFEDNFGIKCVPIISETGFGVKKLIETAILNQHEDE